MPRGEYARLGWSFGTAAGVIQMSSPVDRGRRGATPWGRGVLGLGRQEDTPRKSRISQPRLGPSAVSCHARVELRH
jgi:hypothetical protein